MKDKKIYILLVVSILITVIGVSLAFFALNIIGNENAKDVVITTGDLKLLLTDGSAVSLSDAKPGDSVTKTITVKNTGTKEISYNLVWQNLVNGITNNELIVDGTCKNLNSSNTEDGTCSAISKKAVKEGNITSNIPIKPGYTHEYVVRVTFKDTGTLQNYNLNKSFTGKIGITESSAKTIYCTFDGELTQGAEYVNGQYTYRYMQEGAESDSEIAWSNMSVDGWGVQLTDYSFDGDVTSSLCTYVNNKPVISMSHMYDASVAASIDFSSFNTSNVINMSYMFANSDVTKTLNFDSFNTSNVIDMNHMFYLSEVTSLNLNNFDTSNVTDMGYMFGYNNRKSPLIDLNISNFDTSNVIKMNGMFTNTALETIDLSNFDTTNVVNMWGMFYGQSTTIIDLSSFDTSNVTNMNYMFETASDTLKTIYASDKFVINSAADGNMFGNNKLVGGAGTAYDKNHKDGEYARIDGGTNSPGYFTDIADKPVEPYSFSSDSWATIAEAVKNNNISKYKVGDTKLVGLGTYGSHMVRIANTSTPSECSGTGFSQSACGFVVEFTDIVAEHVMKDTADNTGGWPGSSMYTFVNTDLYNSLPYILKNAITDTTVVSGHGNTGESNFTSTDKMYLLSPGEVYSDWSTYQYSSADTAKDLTRTLDYYTNASVTTSSYSGAIKKYQSSAADWWLRTPEVGIAFSRVQKTGARAGIVATSPYGVSPAFRIG